MQLYFGESVRRLRQAAGLTQEQLAQRLHVTFQTIRKWERNESYPDITMLPVLAGLFGVRVDELLGVNQAENERRVQQITTAYDNSEGNSKREHLPTLTAAVADYPLDYRLWVRYLECLLRNTMGIDGALAAHKQAREIYENIAAHCTDDSIRMWAKRLMVMHLHSLAQAEPARQAECEALLGEMPTLRCTREHVAVMVMTGEQQQQARQHLIAELEWLLAHAQYHEAGKAQNKA